MQNEQLLSAWNKLTSDKTIWDYLIIQDGAFYFKKEDKKIFLSSFKTKDLPESPYELTFKGKILTKLSAFANIMSRRPGTEEVTFYSLLNTAQKSFLGTKVDKKILDVVAPPITWRRIEIEKNIRQILKQYIFELKEGFAFVDIGCGGGFDSLEMERIIKGMSNALNHEILPKYDILNLDIDTKWLANNKKLCKFLFAENSNIRRKDISIFDYLDSKTYEDEFKDYDNLIVSCNGFAEFLSDDELRKLYLGIYEMANTFKKKVDIILPFANKNPKQEELGNKIGFKFRAKEKQFMIDMIKDIFKGYNVKFSEKYSQIVLVVER